MTEIIPRDVWCDTPRRGTPPRIADRLPRRWLHHGASGSSSVAVANAYARFHIRTRGWMDVGYSWLVAEGRILEGRGVGRQGAHTAGDNASSYGICLVGSYGSQAPSQRDLDALVWLLRHGHDQGWFTSPTLTGGHRDAPGASTSCPGNGAYRLIPEINERAAQAPTKDWFSMASEADLRRVVREEIERYGRDSLARERLNEITRLCEASALAGVASMRDGVGLDPDPESDQRHVPRLRADEHRGKPYRIADVLAALRGRAEG